MRGDDALGDLRRAECVEQAALLGAENVRSQPGSRPFVARHNASPVTGLLPSRTAAS
jgi:hypothetical protein